MIGELKSLIPEPVHAPQDEGDGGDVFEKIPKSSVPGYRHSRGNSENLLTAARALVKDDNYEDEYTDKINYKYIESVTETYMNHGALDDYFDDYLDSCRELDDVILQLLLESGLQIYAIKYSYKFSDNNLVIDSVLDSMDSVADFLYEKIIDEIIIKFHAYENVNLVDKIEKLAQYSFPSVIAHLDKFQNLTSKHFSILYDKQYDDHGLYEQLEKKIHLFEIDNQTIFIQDMLNKPNGIARAARVINSMDAIDINIDVLMRFLPRNNRIFFMALRKSTVIKEIDHRELVTMIIQTLRHEYDATMLLTNFSLFYRIDSQEYMNILTEIKQKLDIRDIFLLAVEYLSNFVNLSEELSSTIASGLIDSGEFKAFIANMSNFKSFSGVLGGRHHDLARDIIRNGGTKQLIRNFEKFRLPRHMKDFLVNKHRPIPLKEYLFLGEDVIETLSLQAMRDNPAAYRLQAWRRGALTQADKNSFNEFASAFGEEFVVRWWHDASTLENTNMLHIVLPNVLKLYNVSGVAPQAFLGEVLNKQKKDGTVDLITFNAMIEGISLDYKTTIQEVREANVPELNELLDAMEGKNPFTNWQSFKKYYELNDLLKKKEVLLKLNKLSPKRKKFFSKLAFHEDSKVSMQKVFELLDEPEKFLDIEDEHTSAQGNEKKPANYTRFDHLDLTAENLRDALVDGVIDTLAFFPPASKTIEVADKELSDKDLIKYVLQSLGSREKGNANMRLFNTLFNKQSGVLKKLGLNINKFKELKQLTPQMRGAIESLYNQDGLSFRDTRKTKTYSVTVFPPSDPRGHLAGNDTACCMPLGSGKNNVYTFNPTCGQLVVQEKKNGKWRTVAQSVLTPDIDVRHPVPDLLGMVQGGRGQLHDKVSDNVAGKHDIYITADNIEVAPNSKGDARYIENAYRAFLVDYKDFIESKNPNTEINDDFAVIGMGYSDAFNYLPQVDNTFVPICPPSYSDNAGSKSYKLDYEKQGVIAESEWFEPESQPNFESIDLPRGIEELRPQDALAVSYMEGKVYADNESLMQYIHRMSNEIIAASIKNVQDGRPNLMMKAVNNNGDMTGYMLAYEGVLDKSVSEPEPAIYISDLAADTEQSKLAGGKLIKTFVDRVGQEYLAKGNAIPIVFEARDATSYQIMKRHIDKLGNDYGYAYEAEEINAYQDGGDLMHVMVLKPKLYKQTT